MTLSQINNQIRIGWRLFFVVLLIALGCSCDSKEQFKKEKIENFKLQSDIGKLVYEKSILKSIEVQDSIFSVNNVINKADSIYKLEIKKIIKQVYK